MSRIGLYVTDGQYSNLLELTCGSFLTGGGSVRHGNWDQVKPFSRKLIPAGGGLFDYDGTWLRILHADQTLIVSFQFPWMGLSPGATGIGFLKPPAGGPPQLGEKVTGVIREADYDWKKTWVGLGIKGDLQLSSSVFNKRQEGVLGFLVSMHSYQLAFIGAEAHLKADKSKYAGGAGGAACLSVLVVTGVDKAAELTGTPTGGFDVNVAVGGCWSNLVKCICSSRSYGKLCSVIPKAMPDLAEIGKLGEKLHKEEDFITWSKTVVVGSGVDTGSKSLSIWDTPVGAGFEVSFGETEGSIYYSANVFDLEVFRKMVLTPTGAHKARWK